MISFNGGNGKSRNRCPRRNYRIYLPECPRDKQLQDLKQIYEKVLEYQEKANAAIFTDCGILNTKYLS